VIFDNDLGQPRYQIEIGGDITACMEQVDTRTLSPEEQQQLRDQAIRLRKSGRKLHPETLVKHGISDGHWIWIESPRGRIGQEARLFPGILRGLPMATANCFCPEEPPQLYHGPFISKPNVLTNNNHGDPMYGSPDLTCLLCEVYPCSDDDLKEDVFRIEEYGYVESAGEE
jgi:hypothetical protein